MFKTLNLFLFLSFSAQAATEFEIKPLRWLLLPPADQTHEIVSTLQEVGQWASQSPQLILPPRLTLVLSSELSNPYFDSSTQSIFLGFQLRSRYIPSASARRWNHVRPENRTSTTHPKFTRPIWVHEYGHAILDANLEKVAPKFARMIREVTREHEEKKKSGARISKNLQAEYDRLNTLQAGIDEFFGDFVGVLHFENPEAIRDGVFFTNSNAGYRQSAKYRDFDRVQSVSHWTHAEEHEIMSPARSYLWKYSLDGPLMRLISVQKRKGDFVWGAVSAIGELLEELKNSEVPEPKEFNLRLEGKLDAKIGPLVEEIKTHTQRKRREKLVRFVTEHRRELRGCTELFGG